MSTSWFEFFRDCCNLVIGILTFLASNTALGAWVRGLSARLGRKLRSWGFKWPEPPVSPDFEQRREAHSRLLDCLSQNRNASNDISQTLRVMMEQDKKHHQEICEALSDSKNALRNISTDAQKIVEVTEALSNHVRVVAAFEVDRLLRKLPQSIHEAETEPRARHLRAASA